ncbi:hypothetical protein L484_010771 [Morus notabilis]|uniref:Threonylcarbamoyl-AMP synthase n=1 Tax=Morus notabilis TaxID=981085 RepID=W9SKX9_9ROSA|nr:hypothetical protein L484_010771 [Morus notabilis]
MAFQAKLQAHTQPLSLSSFDTLSTRRFGPYRSRLSLAAAATTTTTTTKSPSLQVLAFAVKRSPKRLKYASPRFTKEDELVYVEVDPSGADSWKLEPVVNLLKEGAVGVIPTDTVYALVCDLRNHSAIERLRRKRFIMPLSILCHSFRDIDIYTTGFPRGDGQGHANIFRAVKHCLPGPYTFILSASKELPKQCISVKGPKENEWMIDPVVIADTYGPEGLDFVIDGGLRVADPSTVVDMTVIPLKIVRQGKGPKLPWMVVED